MAVLILAHESDEVADGIAADLVARRVPAVRLNPAVFPRRLSMAARITSTSWHGSLVPDEGEPIELADIRSVWQRRSSQFEMDDRMSDPERAFAYGEARRGLGGVLAALENCLWVNDPMAAARCEYKPVQLAAAVDIGLRIPETFITSDPQAAYRWAKELARPIIYKPLAGVWHADEGQLKVIYTSPVEDPGELLDDRIALTAHLFQEQVPKAFEVRATVVGSQVFAARIDASSDAARRDWRSDYDALSHTAIDLPADINAKLVDLHQRLGLVYGAVDLICDTSGEWLFLETNQGGEFGWIAEQTGLPIPTAIADLLERAE